MLIGNRLVKLNGPAASGRNHIFKICMLSLFSMSYPLAIKNGNGHSPVIIHLHLNSPVFSASPGFPAIFIPIVYAYCLVYTTTSKFMIIIIIYIYIYIYICLFYFIHCTTIIYIYIFVHTTLHMLCTYIDIWNMVDPPSFQPSVRCLKALRSFRRTPAAARPNMVMF